MPLNSVKTVIGLMSGTSMDGIDAALIDTDGEGAVSQRGFVSIPYAPEFRQRLRDAAAHALELHRPGPDALIDAVAAELTGLHAIAVHQLLKATDTDRDRVDMIGFHGHTVAHRPDRKWTWQIGDGALLQAATRIPVIHDFRSDDVAAGGHGAPLAPGYHRARSAGIGRPLGVLNLGGVGNLTWFAADGSWGSFDTGPANALIDDWISHHSERHYDAEGAIAAAGSVHQDVLTAMLDLPWFDAAPPKSLDRADFSTGQARGLSLADGAATLTAFTAETVRLALGHVPALSRLLVTGGGRHNPTLMAMIATRTGVPTEPVEAVGWDGDALEAEAFAWLAVRSAAGKAISWPETTGVPVATTGGRRA
ncbi:MAG: anhydro-N-acetylmuramic acid kinase [Alphaproteobacteria bacterium]|nr:MAG: anhydro-N-acetylmuramic acid kinase [Alphaproteobacteria bacterium]